MSILIPVSAGERIDRVTILRIKLGRVQDPTRRRHVAGELEQLEVVLAAEGHPGAEVRDESEALVARLAAVNLALWEREDELRALEAVGDFGEAFVRAARSVYELNDERHRLKRQLSVLHESQIVEEKFYAGS